MENNYLMKIARLAKAQACAPYSHFKVGAALLAQSGNIYSGCNVESSSYGLTICAERVALYKALSEGERHFTKIAITSNSSQICPPCGACRQVLMDYAPEIEVILFNDRGDIQKILLRDLLPNAFTSNFLKTL
ncbi:cytidine deaminase [candidate division KSB1 bacterium]|nr:cytidine deaminase [candidate division KSB1 bacterium]